jgi:hypothetical protein
VESGEWQGGGDDALLRDALEFLQQRLPGRSDAELRSIAEDEIGRLRARAHLERVARERSSDRP